MNVFTYDSKVILIAEYPVFSEDLPDKDSPILEMDVDLDHDDVIFWEGYPLNVNDPSWEIYTQK